MNYIAYFEAYFFSDGFYPVPKWDDPTNVKRYQPASGDFQRKEKKKAKKEKKSLGTTRFGNTKSWGCRQIRDPTDYSIAA